MPEKSSNPPLQGEAAEQEMRRRSRRSFLVGGVAALTAYGSWRWLTKATPDDGIPWPLRRVLRWNQNVAEDLGSPHGLAPTFSADRVPESARTNGFVGLGSQVETAGWQLNVQHEGRGPGQMLPLQDVVALPRQDLITEFKCVEGWSEVMRFGGVRFHDFVTHFKLGTRSGQAPDPTGNPQDLFRYVYLATPGEGYYVGLDMASALHAQTLLCDTMNGQPLSQEHGAPLRIYLTVKYGYKSLKRVSLIRFQDERPADFWADRGYDWYGGL
jgi:DMSO/TMAO reductase YedYZ molybdopterin-dependent catalytic subunit